MIKASTGGEASVLYHVHIHIHTIYTLVHYSCHATGLRFFVASSGGILQVLHTSSLDLDRVDWDWDWDWEWDWECDWEWGTAIAVWQLKEKLPKRHK